MRFGAPVTGPRHQDAALRQEEAAAVEVALAGLPTTSGRRWWPTRSRGRHRHPGRGQAVDPGAVRIQLARTRARLGLDYLLALRRVELPTARCRPALLALAARQGHHIEVAYADITLEP
jgi:serine/threonine-protein kinase RsbT